MSYEKGWKYTPLEKICVEPRRGSLTGFTFVEVTIVVVLIAVVATIGLPAFTKGREKAMGREAKSNLLRISEAERNYYLEMNKYYPETNTTDVNITSINSELRVYLRNNPSDTSVLDWTYSVSSTDGTDFLAIATRKSTVESPYSNCKYIITDQADEPVPNSSTYCP